jgi:adenylate cyclase
LEQAFEVAQKAASLDDSLPFAHATLGHIYLWKKQHDQAIAEQKKAIALDPNCALCYSELGNILSYARKPEEAIVLQEKAMRLSPQEAASYSTRLGEAYRRLGRHEEAITAIKRSLAFSPNFLGGHLELAVTYSESGREEEARAEVAEVMRLSPNFSLEAVRRNSPYKDPAVLERLLAALHKAGLK